MSSEMVMGRGAPCGNLALSLDAVALYFLDLALPMDELPQTDLGPYCLEELLGRGGMGAVYRAQDQRLDRPVAIKHLPPALSGSELRRQRFRREALSLARLSHPSIVQIFDVVETAEGDWIVMELVRGPTIGELLRQGPLPLPQLLRVGRQVSEGLAEAHSQGILHRDLKADNVMLHHTGHAKILDFGLAKSLADEGEESLSGTGQILGTVHAMSPEQALGRPLDRRSDLFSLGILIYQMAAGEPPFRDSSSLEVLRRIVEKPHLPLVNRRAEAPERLCRLVDHLLEKSPEHRPADARAVAEELDEIVAGSHDNDQSNRPTVTSVPVNDRPTLDPWVPGTEDSETKVFEPDHAALSREPADERKSQRPKALPWGALLVSMAAFLALVITWWIWGTRSDSENSPVSAGESGIYQLMQEGLRYLERPDKGENADKAIAAFEAVLSRDQGSAPAHAGLALAYWSQHMARRDPVRLEQARAIAERAVALDEHLALARIALGNVYAQQGSYHDALEQLKVALQLSPGNADAYRGLGIVHRHRGEQESAREAFENGVESKPTDPYLRYELGTQLYRAGRYGEAAEQFARSVELAPDSIFGYRNLSAAYYMQGKLSEAAEVLQEALLIKPQHSLYSNLGTILFTQGLYLPAAQAFGKALDHGGANFYLYWGNLADAYRQAKGYNQQAVEAYRQAIRLLREQPDHDGHSSLLVLYLAKADRCTEAVSVLRDEAFVASQSRDYFRVAVANEICADRSAALSALESALSSGFSQSEVSRDPDLFDLRSDPGYHRLIGDLGKPADRPEAEASR